MLTKLKMTQKAASYVTYTDELYDIVRDIATVQVSGSVTVGGARLEGKRAPYLFSSFPPN